MSSTTSNDKTTHTCFGRLQILAGMNTSNLDIICHIPVSFRTCLSGMLNTANTSTTDSIKFNSRFYNLNESKIKNEFADMYDLCHLYHITVSSVMRPGAGWLSMLRMRICSPSINITTKPSIIARSQVFRLQNDGDQHHGFPNLSISQPWIISNVMVTVLL